MLFRVEFYNQEEMSEQIALCEDDACSWKEKDKTYIFEKVEKISEKLEEIDAKITQTMQEQRFSMKFRKQFIAAEPPCVSGSKIDQIYLYRIRSPSFPSGFSQV